MSLKTITALRLTPESFAEFGSVLMAPGQAPHRDEYAGKIENTRGDASPNLTFIHALPKEPLIGAVERHEFSSQTFVPMKGARYLVGVCRAAANGGPDEASLIVFVANGGQAVNYNAGVWHSPLCVLDESGEFVMLRWDNGTAVDTELVKLEQAVEVIIPPSLSGF